MKFHESILNVFFIVTERTQSYNIPQGSVVRTKDNSEAGESSDQTSDICFTFLALIGTRVLVTCLAPLRIQGGTNKSIYLALIIFCAFFRNERYPTIF